MSAWRRTARELVLRSALAGASLLLTLGAAEGALRLAARWRGGGKEGLEGQGYTAYDPLLGWRKRPGARVTYRRREYTVELAVNSRGLRDPERGYDAAPGTLRLLALGDSFLEGYSVPLEKTVTQQLEAALARGGRRAEVINAGTLAYSTDQEYLFYRVEGSRYLPRVVLLFFYYNDVVFNDRENYFGRSKPAFRVTDDGRLTLRRRVVPRQIPPAPLEDAARPAPARGRSLLLEWVRERFSTGAPRHYNRLAAVGLWPPLRPRPPRLELRVYERSAMPEVQRAWEVTEAILARLAREVEARGSRLLVVYVPSRMEVHDDTWEATRLLHGLDPAGWDRGRVATRLMRLGQRSGYPVLDLTSPMRAADRGWRGRPYHRFDGHWTASGHGVAAAQVLAFLERSGWLERP